MNEKLIEKMEAEKHALLLDEDEIVLDRTAEEILHDYGLCHLELQRIHRCALVIDRRIALYFNKVDFAAARDLIADILSMTLHLSSIIKFVSINSEDRVVADLKWSEMDQIGASAMFVNDVFSELDESYEVSLEVFNCACEIEHDARELQKMVKNKGDEK